MARSPKLRRGRGDRGAALVEFALVLPVVVMLIFGMISGAIAYNQKQDMTHAAREGSRYGGTLPLAQCAVPADCGGKTWAQLVQSIVIERSSENLTTGDVCVALVTGPDSIVGASYSTSGDTCYDDGGEDTGKRVHVKITKPAEINGVFFKFNTTLNTQATGKYEE